VADYFGARFGKRQSLSTLVTVVALAAVLPYIALQFRALASGLVDRRHGDGHAAGYDAGLGAGDRHHAGGFAILFGARRLDGRERHQGMMTAIALESLVKLLAFLCVAALASPTCVARIAPATWTGAPSPWRASTCPRTFSPAL
jgi:Na+/proline symporter